MPKMNKALGSVLLLLGGTAGSQFLLIIASPLLTRLYEPDQFGVLALFVSLIGLLSVIASARYELAIPIPWSRQTAVNLAALCQFVVVIVAALSCLVLVIWHKALATWINTPVLNEYYMWIPVGVLVVGFFQVYQFLEIRDKRFSIIARSKLFQSGSVIFLQILLSSITAGGLLVGHVLGQALATIMLARFARSKKWGVVGYKKVIAVSKRYRHFPIYGAGAGLLNSAGLHLPAIFFASFFGLAEAGIYALAHRVLASPISMIGQAVAQVFLSEAPERYRTGSLSELVSALNTYLLMLGLPVGVILIVAGREVFSFIFGPSWGEAGEIAQWLALWLVVALSTSPISMVFNVAEQQRRGLIMQAVLLVLRITGISVGVYCDQFGVAVAAFSIGGYIGYILYLTVACWTVRANLLTLLLNYSCASIFLLMAFFLQGYWREIGGIDQLFISAGASALLIGYYVIVLKRVMNDSKIAG
jgi:O-antigen/teichoic acid export membrane protein